MKILMSIKNFFIHKREYNKKFASGYKFKSTNSLIVKKLIEYIPAALMTNLSSLLILSIDGIVVGNFVGSEALASINIFYPATLLIYFFSTILSVGVSTALSLYIGQHDYEKLLHIKSATKFMLVIAFIVVSVIQIPIINLIISSYNLDAELVDMTYKYAIGVMILNPFTIISTVSVYQLQIIGKMKVIMYLSIVESVLNVVLDLLFVGVLKLGIAGAGYGTAIAGVTRSLITIVYMLSKTDMYNNVSAKVRLEDIKEILSLGTPDSLRHIVLAVQSYAMMKIILIAFGNFGGDIKGVCSFCYNIINVLMIGMVSAMRPLVGFFEGAKDTFSLRNVVKKGLAIIAALIMAVVIIIEINPYLFYKLHGINVVSNDALLSLRIYSLSFLFTGFNAIYRLYLTNKRDTKFVLYVTVLGNLFLPVVAYLLYKLFTPYAIWLADLIVMFIAFAIYSVRKYHFDIYGMFEDLDISDDKIPDLIKNNKVDYEKMGKILNDRLLYMSVKPEEVIEASRYVRQHALEKGYSENIAYRMSLCMEEMIAYTKESQDKKEIHTQIVIRYGKDYGVFMMFDDGEEIALDKDQEHRELTISNYTLLKKIAKSYQYEYVLNMNYTKFNF